MKVFSTLAISLIFASTAAFASSKVTLDFENCTNKNVTVKWDGYNFSFDTDIGKDETDHGSFTIGVGNTTKTLYTHFDIVPEGHVKVNLSGGVHADFKVEQNLNPLGGLKYITASSNIKFKRETNVGAKVYATNTVKIGC